MKKKSLILMSFILSMSILTACNEKKEASKQEAVLVSVETQTIKTDSIESNISVSSKVEANEELTVVPKMAGTVNNIYVKLGDTVSKGQTLFTIDDKDIQAQINQAKAGLNIAKANYELTVNGSTPSQIQQLESTVANLQSQYDDLQEKIVDMEELLTEGAVAEQDVTTLKNNANTLKIQLDSAQKSLELSKNNVANATKGVSEATIKQAEASIATATNQLSNTKVTAGIGGIVSTLNLVDGQLVSPQAPALIISDMDTVKLKFQVSEDAIRSIQVGSKIYATIESISDKPFVASVTNVAQLADKKTSLYPVEVALNNADHKIKPGMFASIKIVLSDKSNILSLPLNAIMQKDDEKFVYVLDDTNVVHKTIVTTGMQNDEKVEIKSGVTQGMKVVVKGQDFIADGSKVNVVSSTKE